MEMLMLVWKPVAVLIMVCLSLNYVCDMLGGHLETISEDIKMDNDIAGATFLAVSSSLPEFLTSFISIVVYKQFEDVGFATVAGSGIFNALLIPMLAILFYKGSSVEFNTKVAKRDIGFYIATVGILAVSMFCGVFSWVTGIALMVVYGLYIKTLMSHQSQPIQWRKADMKNVVLAIGWMIPLAMLVHLAVGQALLMSELLQVKGFIVSVIILAGVTSIPDAFMSINEAKKGELESAVSNAIGSNVFDLCVCLGLPLVITGSVVKVSFASNLGVLGFLVASIVMVGWVLFTGCKKWKAIPMATLYVIFITYVLHM